MNDKPKRRHPITVDELWALDRLGEPSLAPDAGKLVLAVTTPSMEDNKSRTALWLLSMRGDAPRRLTQAGDKDGHPAFSPRGDVIAFTGVREQEGRKDTETQLYLIATDGGEARRVGEVATGVETFRWLPDGRRIVFASWVWPDAKGSKGQTRRHKALAERKESGYATSESLWRYWDHNVPMDRAAHLHVMDVASGKHHDLLEGSGFELPRAEVDTTRFNVSPDSRHIAFAYDPAPHKRLDNRNALAEVDVDSRRVRKLMHDPAWDMNAPCYSPDGLSLAFLASHQGLKATMPAQLALLNRSNGSWEVVSGEWDHAVEAPLHWTEDGSALLFAAEQKGRRHLWRFDLASRRAEIIIEGSWLESFDHAAGSIASVMSSAMHPARVHAHLPGSAPLRIETFNDTLMSSLALARVEERWVEGAQGDPVQMWLTYPAAFDMDEVSETARHKNKASKPRKTWPLLHCIHGGPHTAAGDVWHSRWNTQVFAAQGYVVCQVNYHGSTSFGYAFTDSITHRWGELELQDVEAATDALLREPWIDAQRIYASGGSYGGYMVAWMNGHVPEGRYAAYICHAGCFDWRATFASDAFGWFPQELGAWYWEDGEATARQSPVSFVQHMRTPTLVTHGLLDYRVPDAQGLAYYHSLKALGVDARLLWFPDENHWVLKPRNSRQWHQEFFAWLDGHRGAAASSRLKKKLGKGDSKKRLSAGEKSKSAAKKKAADTKARLTPRRSD
jgi:dipeptidyl aminopeptidase/acylaminoacyl peptidase